MESERDTENKPGPSHINFVNESTDDEERNVVFVKSLH